MRSKSGDISLVASIGLILIALVATVGGAVMIETVHAEQMSQSGALTSSSPISSATSSEITITIESGSGANTTSIYYSPPQVMVEIGVNNTVTWVNKDSAPHTVTSDISGAFNSGNMAPEATWSFTFNTPGTYNYHCSYHSWMRGTIIVKQG